MVATRAARAARALDKEDPVSVQKLLVAGLDVVK